MINGVVEMLCEIKPRVRWLCIVRDVSFYSELPEHLSILAPDLLLTASVADISKQWVPVLLSE